MRVLHFGVPCRQSTEEGFKIRCVGAGACSPNLTLEHLGTSTYLRGTKKDVAQPEQKQVIQTLLAWPEAAMLKAQRLPWSLCSSAMAMCFSESSKSSSDPYGGCISLGSVLQTDVEDSCNRSEQQPARKTAPTLPADGPAEEVFPSC
ncbi:hypothetical protein AV530_016087 [Patagioenas fasciata monilis]|uniref:Uncharacterized protein n=1 Tax=Patagioenas fasciata monilis TaxID=372326 RepID=A0A1V4KK57_PATFA|nr:hypothetical protein AV530_016087 [Patagioenas fasciata monilis]